MARHPGLTAGATTVPVLPDLQADTPASGRGLQLCRPYGSLVSAPARPVRRFCYCPGRGVSMTRRQRPLGPDRHRRRADELPAGCGPGLRHDSRLADDHAALAADPAGDGVPNARRAGRSRGRFRHRAPAGVAGVTAAGRHRRGLPPSRPRGRWRRPARRHPQGRHRQRDGSTPFSYRGNGWPRPISAARL